jgi:hypothetical protein
MRKGEGRERERENAREFERVNKYLLEHLCGLLIGVVQHESIAEIVDVLFLLKLWNTCRKHHHEEIEENRGVPPQHVECHTGEIHELLEATRTQRYENSHTSTAEKQREHIHSRQ